MESMMERERRTPDRRRDGLDPVRHPERWEDLVSRIAVRAQPVLERRREDAGVPGVLLQWARPALATAATVILLMAGAALLGLPGPREEVLAASVVGAVVPESYAAWLVADYEPTVSELVVALEDVGR